MFKNYSGNGKLIEKCQKHHRASQAKCQETGEKGPHPVSPQSVLKLNKIDLKQYETSRRPNTKMSHRVRSKFRLTKS